VFKNNVINLIIRYLKAKSEVKTDMLNNDAFLNLENGLFDIKTYQIKPHTPAVLSTIRLNVTYDANATCPLWEEAVHTIVGDAEYIQIIQEFFGLCMTRETYDKALFLIGEGSNGKSTLLDVLKGILGDDNTCEVQLEQLEKSIMWHSFITRF
jgi:putative DNA primase/helicase